MTLRALFKLSLLLLTVNIACATYPTTQSTGEPWPMPRLYEPTPDVLGVSANNFQFKSAGEVDCDILVDAYVRYQKLTFGGYGNARKQR